MQDVVRCYFVASLQTSSFRAENCTYFSREENPGPASIPTTWAARVPLQSLFFQLWAELVPSPQEPGRTCRQCLTPVPLRAETPSPQLGDCPCSLQVIRQHTRIPLYSIILTISASLDLAKTC